MSLASAQRDKDIIQRLVQPIIWSSEVQVHLDLYKCNWVWLHNQNIGYNSSQINTSFWFTNKNTFSNFSDTTKTCLHNSQSNKPIHCPIFFSFYILGYIQLDFCLFVCFLSFFFILIAGPIGWVLCTFKDFRH